MSPLGSDHDDGPHRARVCSCTRAPRPPTHAYVCACVCAWCGVVYAQGLTYHCGGVVWWYDNHMEATGHRYTHRRCVLGRTAHRSRSNRTRGPIARMPIRGRQYRRQAVQLDRPRYRYRVLRRFIQLPERVLTTPTTEPLAYGLGALSCLWSTYSHRSYVPCGNGWTMRQRALRGNRYRGLTYHQRRVRLIAREHSSRRKAQRLRLKRLQLQRAVESQPTGSGTRSQQGLRARRAEQHYELIG